MHEHRHSCRSMEKGYGMVMHIACRVDIAQLPHPHFPSPSLLQAGGALRDCKHARRAGDDGCTSYAEYADSLKVSLRM